MELVNNYFSGSAGTVTFGPGGPGYSSDNGSSGTGRIDFSALIAEKSTADYRDTNSNAAGNTQNGPSRGQNVTDRTTAKQTVQQTTRQTSKETAKQTEEIDESDEMKARTEEDIVALQALVSAMEADRITPDVNAGVEFAAEDDTAALSALVSSLKTDSITPDVNTGVGFAAEDDTAALSALVSSLKTDSITPDANTGVGFAAEDDTAALSALVSSLKTDSITPDVNTGVEFAAEDDTAAFRALVSSMETDKISPGGNSGVEIVTERIVTEAKAPTVIASSKLSDDSTGPVPVLQNAVPTEDGRSITLDNKNGEDTEAVKKAALETERNGAAVTDSKTENKVSDTKVDSDVSDTKGNSATAFNRKGNVDDTGKSPEEILKSLEGQGHIVSSSGSYPKGEPSNDTNGPTGRPGDTTIEKTLKVEKGPGASKTDTNKETNTEANTETAQDPTAAVPVGFATQTQKTTAQQELPVGTNETMMMRTTESTLTDDLTNLVSSRFPSKNGQLTIELDPEKLGKITINVNYDSGHAAVSISATNSKTLEMLTQSAPQMANIIQQKTGQQTDVFVPNTQQSNTKHDMAEGRESNENREQQRSRQNEQQSRTDETSNTAFLHQMRLGLV